MIECLLKLNPRLILPFLSGRNFAEPENGEFLARHSYTTQVSSIILIDGLELTRQDKKRI